MGCDGPRSPNGKSWALAAAITVAARTNNAFMVVFLKVIAAEDFANALCRAARAVGTAEAADVWLELLAPLLTATCHWLYYISAAQPLLRAAKCRLVAVSAAVLLAHPDSCRWAERPAAHVVMGSALHRKKYNGSKYW